MSKIFLSFCASLLTVEALFAAPALTIYNQNFAVVRDAVPLDLKQGVNDISFTDITAHLEPDSVILRDPSGKLKLQILEQNYRNDPVSQELLLSLNEGKTIDFLVKLEGKPDEVIQGKIIRSGYSMHSAMAMQQYGQPYYQTQQVMSNAEPIIEVAGKLQFGLPGQPIFPSLGDDTILKPLLTWKLNADSPGKLDGELAYVTSGMNWEANYNVVASENSDLLDIVGWVTMDNQSGKTFTDATIKLMAGNVNKLQNPNVAYQEVFASAQAAGIPQPNVTEKAFDDYHLYTLPLPTTLHDGETKQVEFIHATGVKSEKIYVYDGVELGQYANWNSESFRNSSEVGTQSSTKVSVMREFKNSEDNHLGMPLPKGRVRFYKQDAQQLEFTRENVIDHTPKDELVKIYTGDAFDLVGERTRTNFKVDNAGSWCDESFQIKLRNHKTEPVEIRVVEHLYRWNNWAISENSDPFVKTNAQEMEFRIQLKPDEEKTVSYTAHYSW